MATSLADAPASTRSLEFDSQGGTGAVLFSQSSPPRVSTTWTTTLNVALDGYVEVENEGSVIRGPVVITPAGVRRVSSARGPVLTILLDADAHRATYLETARGRSFCLQAPGIVAIASDLASRLSAGSRPIMGDAFALTQRLFPLGPSSLRDPRIARIIALLGSSGDDPPPLAMLAHAAGVTPGHLSERFTQVVGLPLRSWLLWQRVRRSLSLLDRHRALGAAAIAATAGFSDQPHMVRTFSRLLAYTPGDLQRAMRPGR
jgi:AraC-like DNA-binding protein